MVAGKPLPIRSDEYLAWSPIKVGQVEAGFPEERLFGLGIVEVSKSWRHHIPYPNLGQIVFSPQNIPLFVLPTEIGFAAYWLLPFFAAFLGVFIWLRVLGVRLWVASATGSLVCLSPVSVWWSGWNLIGVAHASIGCAGLIAAIHPNRGRLVRSLAFVGGVWAFAGLPWFYQPWALAAVACFVPISGWLLLRNALTETPSWLGFSAKRSHFWGLSVLFAGITAALWLAFYLHEHEYFMSLANTDYPGQRRSVGGGIGLETVFSSIFSRDLSTELGSALSNSNLSEVSMGWTIVSPLVFILTILNGHWTSKPSTKPPVVPALLASCLGFAWIFVSLPESIARLTPLSLIPPIRLAPYIGLLGCLALAFHLEGRMRDGYTTHFTRSGRLYGLLLLIVLILWVSTEFKNTHLGTITKFGPFGWIVVSAIFILAGRSKILMVGVAALLLISLSGTVTVNPISRGVGDIGSSDIVEKVHNSTSKNNDPVWAVDDLYLVPVVNIAGVNSLSSFNDPVSPKGWGVLDPLSEARTTWNRFAYVLFYWRSGTDEVKIEAPSPDVVTVGIDPCSERLTRLELTHILSTTQLTGDCLNYVTSTKWMGIERYIYSRESLNTIR